MKDQSATIVGGAQGEKLNSNRTPRASLMRLSHEMLFASASGVKSARNITMSSQTSA